eukprot:gene12085-biopygen4313
MLSKWQGCPTPKREKGKQVDALSHTERQTQWYSEVCGGLPRSSSAWRLAVLECLSDAFSHEPASSRPQLHFAIPLISVSGFPVASDPGAPTRKQGVVTQSDSDRVRAWLEHGWRSRAWPETVSTGNREGRETGNRETGEHRMQYMTGEPASALGKPETGGTGYTSKPYALADKYDLNQKTDLNSIAIRENGDLGPALKETGKLKPGYGFQTVPVRRYGAVALPILITPLHPSPCKEQNQKMRERLAENATTSHIASPRAPADALRRPPPEDARVEECHRKTSALRRRRQRVPPVADQGISGKRSLVHSARRRRNFRQLPLAPDRYVRFAAVLQLSGMHHRTRARDRLHERRT